MAELQILIAAYGPDALMRISSLRHDTYPGVEYVVSWQNYENGLVPDEIKERKDFKIFLEDSIGLCNNRNALLQHATADFALVSDDDLIYENEHLNNALHAFENNSQYHFLTFQYESKDFPKKYPGNSFVFPKTPKGYFVTSMEMGFNLKKIREDFGKAAFRFNPAYGVNGTTFYCGEEDILIYELQKKGMRGKYLPVTICENTDSTTSERIGNFEGFIETKGAVVSYIKPITWPMRMLTHAWRARKEIPIIRYCKWWLSGIKKARIQRVFENY